MSSQQQLFADKTLEEAIDQLNTIFERQIKSDPLWSVLRMEFWLVASRDPEVRRRVVAEAEPYRKLAGEMIDAMLAKAGHTGPFNGRELGVLLNALATGLAIQVQHEPESVDPTLLVRAARQPAGLPVSPAGPRSRERDFRPLTQRGKG
jgi:hypothetical protein